MTADDLDGLRRPTLEQPSFKTQQEREQKMGSSSRKMRRQNDKIGGGQKKTYTEDEAYKWLYGPGATEDINSLRDAIADFHLEPHKYPTPLSVIQRWRTEGTSVNDIYKRLICIFAFTEETAAGLMEALVPGAEIILGEELYDLRPDLTDSRLEPIRAHLLESKNGRLYMRPHVWGYSQEANDKADAAMTAQQQAIDRAVFSLQRTKLWPEMRKREDTLSSSFTRITIGDAIRAVHPVWSEAAESSFEQAEELNYEKWMTDPELWLDYPDEKERAKFVLGMAQQEIRSLADGLYRATTLAYAALEDQGAGLGKAYVEELTDQAYSKLTGDKGAIPEGGGKVVALRHLERSDQVGPQV